MNNKDLIRRGDAEEARDELVRVLNCINSSGTLDYADYCELFNTIEREFGALKFVPREMSARELLLTEERMLRDDADAYREYAPLAWNRKVDEAVAFAEQWAREHPEEVKDE